MKAKSLWNNIRRKYGILLVMFILIAICSIASPEFFSATNFFNILKQVCVYALIAFAEAILIISGNIDLSAGACMCFSGLMAIPVYIATQSIVLAVLTAIAVGTALHFVTGLMVAKLRLAPFVATLAMNMSVRGLCKVYTQGAVLTDVGGPGFAKLGQSYIFGKLPVSVLVMIAALIILWIALDKTRFGRNLYAIGGNPEAARASGINVARYRWYAYMFAGAFIGLAGFMFASRVNSGIPTAGAGYEGQGISAAVIGGIGFAGGTGNAFGVVIGAVIIGIINNILNLLHVDSYLQEVIQGLIIVVAVVIDLQTKKQKK